MERAGLEPATPACNGRSVVVGAKKHADWRTWRRRRRSLSVAVI